MQAALEGMARAAARVARKEHPPRSNAIRGIRAEASAQGASGGGDLRVRPSDEFELVVLDDYARRRAGRMGGEVLAPAMATRSRRGAGVRVGADGSLVTVGPPDSDALPEIRMVANWKRRARERRGIVGRADRGRLRPESLCSHPGPRPKAGRVVRRSR